MKFLANYYDGLRSTATEVEVALEHNVLRFQIGVNNLEFTGPAFSIQPALGKANRIIELNNGGRLEFEHLPGFDAENAGTSGIWRWIYKLENNLGYVAAAVSLIGLFMWVLISYGVPYLSEKLANVLPIETEAVLGKQVIRSMDMEDKIFQASSVEKSRQVSIEKNLEKLCKTQTFCPNYTLLFRDSALLGANAFALPGGYIVVTDDLIALAEDDAEVIAVLAHELGHIVRRHAIRQILQSTLSGLVMVAIVGDFDSIASGVPATLMHMRYTRDMENEADAYALQALQTVCIPPVKFVHILERLSKHGAHQDKNKNIANDIAGLFSTHPDTALRLEKFKAAKFACKQ